MYASKKPILIDMNPGACVWSAALHDYLKPRNHILLEPEKRYAPILEEFTAARPNAYWVPLDGYEWATYSKLFKPNPPCPPWPVDRAFPDFDPKFVPPEDGVNPDIIFTGNLSFSQIKEERLLAQFLNCTTLGLWVQKYGRVRYLIWAHDELKERYLPRSVGSRGRATVISETVCDVREIASSPILRTGKGRPRPNEIELDDEGNVVIPTYEARTTVGRPSLGKKKVERTVGRPRKLRMSVEEIGDALKRIEEARGDEAALEALEAELIAKEMTSKKYSRRKIAAAKKAEKEDTDAEKPTDEEGAESTEDMPKKRMGRPRVFGPEPLKKKKGRSRYSGQAMLTPELERIRVNLIRVVKRDHKAAKDITDELFDEINAKNISMIRQRRKIAEGVQVYLESDREGWISGMEHPPWWYKNNPAEIESLVDTILERRSTKHTPEKTGFEHHIQGTGEETAKQIEALESLEDPEKKEDKVLSEDEGKSTSFDEFEDRWVKKSDAFGIHRGNEDAAIAYQKGVLKWHKRPFEPIAVEDSDFWPKVSCPHIHSHLQYTAPINKLQPHLGTARTPRFYPSPHR